MRARKEAGRERDLRSSSVTLPPSHFLDLLPTSMQKKGACSFHPSSKQSDCIRRMKTFLLELVANEATKSQGDETIASLLFCSPAGKRVVFWHRVGARTPFGSLPLSSSL